MKNNPNHKVLDEAMDKLLGQWPTEHPIDNRNEEIGQIPEINCSTVDEREEETKTNCFEEAEGVPPEINWSTVVERKEATKTNCFEETEAEEGTLTNWFQVAVGENARGAQAFSPVGKKVLLVDDYKVWQANLENMLTQCNYIVTSCNSAAMALTLVQDRSNVFDLVLCEVHMADMDGFKLLEALQEEVPDLPVILMSSNLDESEVVIKAMQTACYYLLKPISLQTVEKIWEPVVHRRNKIEARKDGDFYRENSRKRTGKEEAKDDPVELVNENKKTSRLVWSSILHKKFVDAVTALGVDDAKPKEILERMNEKDISRGNVASHLQKYRMNRKDQDMLNDNAKDLGGGAVSGHY